MGTARCFTYDALSIPRLHPHIRLPQDTSSGLKSHEKTIPQAGASSLHLFFTAPWSTLQPGQAAAEKAHVEPEEAGTIFQL